MTDIQMSIIAKMLARINMFLYTFVLDTGITDRLVGDSITLALKSYFQRRGTQIVGGDNLVHIDIRGHPKSVGKALNIQKSLLDDIVKTLKIQNAHLIPLPVSPPAPRQPTTEEIQQQRCTEMQNDCPEGSNEADPITSEDWCTEIPYQEFVKSDKYLSMCYRLNNLMQTFKAQLEAEKMENPFPMWPNDPFNRNPLSPERLEQLYEQAVSAKLDIPTVFKRFINGLRTGAFDVDAAMEGSYIGITDKVNPKYMDGFVTPALDILFKEDKPEMSQEEQDLELALKLAKQFEQGELA